MGEENSPAQGATPCENGDMSEAEIDENLEETFPASDPPSWTLGTDHKSKPPAQSNRPESENEAAHTARE